MKTINSYKLLTVVFSSLVFKMGIAASSSVVEGLPVGTWYAFANSQMETVAPSGTDVSAVMSAWSSGVYDTDRDQLVVWGGGHSDYSGNEVYTFGPLTGSNPTWTRVTDPSNPPANNTAYAADGRPVSRHTYDALDYMPAPYNAMASCAIGSQYSNGYGNTALDFFNFTSTAYGNEAVASALPWTRGPTPPENTNSYASVCRYNPVTKQLWYFDGQTLMQYNPATNTWSSHAQFSSTIYNVGAIDTKRNTLVVYMGNYNNGGLLGVEVWDLNNPDTAPFTANIGGSGLSGDDAPGFVYDPVNDRFVAWDGGTTLYALSIPSNLQTGTWNWSVIPLAAGNTVNPGSTASGGTYGRFRYVPSLNAVVVVSAVDQPVYLMKLEIPPAPKVTLTASPASIVSGGSSTLSWSTTNATSCTASGAWSGSKATSGTQSVSSTSTGTYTLSCTGTGGSSSSTVTVTVIAPAASGGGAVGLLLLVTLFSLVAWRAQSTTAKSRE